MFLDCGLILLVIWGDSFDCAAKVRQEGPLVQFSLEARGSQGRLCAAGVMIFSITALLLVIWLK